MRELRNAITRAGAQPSLDLAGIVLREDCEGVPRACPSCSMGARLRRLREERGLTQAALAQALQLSPSDLNQLEHDQRPLEAVTRLRQDHERARGRRAAPLDEDEARLIADLREALSVRGVEPSPGGHHSRARGSSYRRSAAPWSPCTARYRDAIERTELPCRAGSANVTASASPSLVPMAYEEVRDFFYARHNDVAELEAEAERLNRESKRSSYRAMRPGARTATRQQAPRADRDCPR